MMNLILWETNDTLLPTDPEEGGKLFMSMSEMVKKSVDSGDLKIWGVSAGGGRGFAVSELNAKEINAMTLMYTPYIKFEVTPMLSVDEAMDVLKGMQQ